ncbi:hypothetical protein Tdes44962_MAKER08922 [Teratosphaeria destructans]|uniref:AB hydrolase-1 domain-containing protein n=1 Tax=Teratosphaeria destructans TaxID=418781 RepID=A0A9W7SUU2_9PEZI|nr:hypothetical protein Tdes44962_MAKER08922 [Teratosphaeria destructans]
MTSSSTSRKMPPPLPPRTASTVSTDNTEAAPPPYESLSAKPTAEEPVSDTDPRSSSQQSLVPSDSNQQHDRRRLLLIYIHGFMGNEMSFRSFPAHVHNLLTVLLAESHVVHTKIYPRYRSRRNISFARDDFSRWLEPHEDAKTDVVLLGHSMGGLLAAEVAIMPAAPSAARPLKHRILGTVNFDVPFLGMHPGIIKSGLASIFMPSEEVHGDRYSPELKPADANSEAGPSTAGQPVSPPNRIDTLWTPGKPDPNFNPSFTNDVVLPMRKGWRNAWHFVNKHSGDLKSATKALVSSHMEFGGAMANYNELKLRYARIRALEEQNDDVRKSVVGGRQTPPRVRFINYYTASTGRAKKPRAPTVTDDRQTAASLAPSSLNLAEDGQRSARSSRSPSPSISLQEHRSDGSIIAGSPDLPADDDPYDDEDWNDAAETLTIQEPEPIDENESLHTASTAITPTSTHSLASSLPPIPDLPDAPPPLDTSYIQDPETKKLVEKEHARAIKAYEQAVKDWQKAVRDRAKLEEKKEKAARKEARSAEKAEKAKMKADEKQREREMTHSEKEELRLQKEKERMEAESRRLRGEPDPSPSAPTLNHDYTTSHDTFPAPTPPELSPPSPSPSAPDPATSVPSPTHHKSRWAEKPLKDRRFCVLPPADSQNQIDPCWVRIFMANVDEVGAHCGLFFVDERYERLVGDVAERVERWVLEDVGEREAGYERGLGDVGLD